MTAEELFPGAAEGDQPEEDMFPYGIAALLAVAGVSPKSPPAPATPEGVRAAVRRSLPPLWTGAEAWRAKTFGEEKDRCASCHHVPFAVWTHHEALRRGFDVDRAKLDDLTAWALDFAAADGYRPELVDGFLDTLVLSREGVRPGPTAAEAYARFARRLAGQQLPDGSWKVWDGTNLREPGMQVVAGRLRVPKPPTGARTAAQVVAETRTAEEQEAVAVDTMWTLLGVDALGRSELPADAKRIASDSRRRALEWVAAAGTGRRSDWLALRAVVERRCGDPGRVAGRRDALLARQNRDGGWGLSPGDPSHPLVTGQCLFALAEVGTRGGSPAVRRAWAYLLAAQAADGTWAAPSRLGQSHRNAVTTYWGTAWATLGLLRSLPDAPSGPHGRNRGAAAGAANPSSPERMTR